MKEKFNFILLFFFFAFNILSIAQSKRANIWYFGNKAGIDFNSGSPVALTNSAMYAFEGSAAISDASGSLLFYTDGDNVWNKNHTLMPNGTGLWGGSGTSTQAAIIIPEPGSNSLYYIFTVAATAWGAYNGIAYSVVDMSLNGGLGDVTTKNTPLITPACEKISAVKNCDGSEYWVATHQWNSADFYVYHVTASGISAPIISTAGASYSGQLNINSIGQMKFSPDGKRIACTHELWPGTDHVEVFDFNNTSGVVSNVIDLTMLGSGSVYGISFSPDGTKLYVSEAVLNTLYQFNLSAGSQAAIQASRTLIGTSNSTNIAALQNAPDGKIYAARYSLLPFLGVINNPNSLGATYTDNGFFLGGQSSEYGLPTFIESYFDTALAGLNAAVTGTTTICPGQSATLTASGGTNYSWNTGITNNPIIVSPTSTTSYSVIVTNTCGSDTAFVTVTISPLPTAAVSSATICSGQNATLTASGGSTYSWNNGAVTSVITVNPTITTSYTVSTFNASGCSATISATVIVFPPPTAAVSSATICSGQNATLTASGGTTYSWVPTGQTTSAINPATAGTYTVIAFIGSCSDTASAAVIVNPLPTATAWSNTTIAAGSTTTVTASGGVSYLWSNGSNMQTIIVSPSVTTMYCVTVTDANGCKDDTCVTVTMEDPCSTMTGELYLPNAFSPNRDGENDVLKIYYGNFLCIKTLDITIYDRWGEKVFETTNATFQWDGSSNGQIMNSSVFVYYLRATLTSGEEIVRKGNVSLIR